MDAEEAKHLCCQHGDQYVRAFLVSLKKIIDESLDELGGPIEHDMTFDCWADAAFDDAFCGDRLSEMVAEVLHARMDESIESDTISMAADEFRRFVI